MEHCRCPSERLEVRLRTVARGAVHVVKQCPTCGRQVGGPLGKKALEGLPESAVPVFDSTLEDRYRARMMDALAQERASLPVLPMDPIAQRIAAEMETERLATGRVATLAQELAEVLDPAKVADALTAQAVALRRAQYEALSASTQRFRDEPELKQWLMDHLAEDLELVPEVVGRHLAEGSRVEIDFMAYPKAHLIDAGFVPWHFGIEVKHLNPLDGFSRKASRALWQTVSYTDSSFEIGGRAIRPRFALLFSNLSFEPERALLKNFGRLAENDWVLWRGLLQLANHANVGTLDIKGTASSWQGWVMRFSTGGTYFSRRHGNRFREPIYRESNRDLVEKVRIGNF